ncbi:MOSC domain containing protein [Acanthamoeba castellanii str. Neff]|uniref:MOSC domain containing protein n=1 Tax=Acanthamoeba castellanii (strain ATCC 30010 / Neff) TaxID=1257118 RepID=L8HKV4_ACACF|nr:MOSC domain containing protein [Acanthamoeba castellanii str. Neff]ELR25011.1 MOSC domain containing protein [Acanthamoeba castellanii str. Neff]
METSWPWWWWSLLGALAGALAAPWGGEQQQHTLLSLLLVAGAAAAAPALATLAARWLGGGGLDQGSSTSADYRVTQLVVYPIKSCAGTSLTEATFDAHGFEHDRRWMLVSDTSSSSESSSPLFFVTQRVCPTLALVVPRLTATSLLVDAPHMPTLRVELKSQAHVARMEQMRKELGLVHPPEVEARLAEEAKRKQGGQEQVHVAIWSDKVPAIDEGDEAAQWFSKYLKRPIRLVRVPDDNQRLVPQDYRVEGEANTVAFGDGFPFLLTSEGSLAGLNRELPEPVPMNRGRPEDDVPFVEDTWGLVRIGTHPMHVVKPCTRCKLTTVDQAKGEFGSAEEPLRTLRRVRSSPDGKSVYFGQNLIHAAASGTVRVGDTVRVLRLTQRPVALRPPAPLPHE